MQIDIIAFGRIREIIGNPSITLTGVPDTDELIRKLNSIYPELINMKFTIAIDRQIINENKLLKNHNTVALLPPFSGG
jgi:molybdopterin synthase sulfur carrier subunit